MPFPLLRAPLARALAARGYAEPTPVQAAVLAPETADRDLVVSAQTGSGKTVAYGLGIADTLFGAGEEALPQAGVPLGLVVAPTRELAMQVQGELFWLYAEAGARIVACVGGMDPRAEARRLASGAHLVVGTPGRLRDHLERGNLDASGLKALVLDEADEMLDLGFREDLEFILEATPAERRTLLFSATMPKPIAGLARRYQRDALRLAVEGGAGGHADIDYRAVRVAPHETEHAVVNLLRFYDSPTAMVFCNTRNAVRHIGSTLAERGFATVVLSGELSQQERNRALQALRDRRARVCVATDVAARGIDLPSLDLVIHAELPNDAEVLQHRSGRTGRAGRKGTSALLVPLSRRRRAESLLAAASVDYVWEGPPAAETIRRRDAERLLADPVLTDETSEEDAVLARTLLEGASSEGIAAALVRLYRAQLPAPEEVFDPGPARDARPPREKGERAERGERGAGPPSRDRPPDRGPSLWFRLSIGRRNDADPRWLLPMICRRGKVTRADIGAIRIFDRETKFEVAEAAAERMIAAARHPGGEEIRIDFLGSDPGSPPAGRPPARPGPAGPPPARKPRRPRP